MSSSVPFTPTNGDPTSKSDDSFDAKETFKLGQRLADADAALEGLKYRLDALEVSNCKLIDALQKQVIELQNREPDRIARAKVDMAMASAIAAEVKPFLEGLGKGILELDARDKAHDLEVLKAVLATNALPEAAVDILKVVLPKTDYVRLFETMSAASFKVLELKLKPRL